MSLHAILDELDGVIGAVAKEAKSDLAPVWGVISRLRSHADQEAAVLEQHGAADLKQLLSDAETAAAPVVQEAEHDAQDLAQTAAADVESAVTPATEPAPGPTTSSSESPSPETAPTTTAPSDSSSPESSTSSSDTTPAA